MLTIKQLERMWDAGRYPSLLDGLLISRAETALGDELRAAGSLAAAAMGMVRLEELDQTHVPLFGKFVRAILAAQQSDGGWAEIAPSALCLRSLMIDQGRGEAVERGLAWLANLQQQSGIWPRVPLRRMPADSDVSAFVLLQLGRHDRFRQAIRFDAAMSWFEENTDALSPAAKTLWTHAKLRCQTREYAGVTEDAGQSWMWS